MWWNRCDGDLVRGLDADRRIMPYLMRGRNECFALFDMTVPVEQTEAFLAEFSRRQPEAPATFFHVVLWALARTLEARPRLNRFVAGGRLYQRTGIWISFAAKQALSDDAPLLVVKRRFDPSTPFPEMVRDVRDQVSEIRTGAKSRVDRELEVLLRLPGSALRAVLAAERLADRLGALPRSFIEPDPMFASAWVANLGSLKMDPVYHHLYEYGNAGVFCTIGRITDEPVVEDKRVKVGRVAHLRFTYDERIDDGMYAGEAAADMLSLIRDPLGHGCVLPAPARLAS